MTATLLTSLTFTLPLLLTQSQTTPPAGGSGAGSDWLVWGLVLIGCAVALFIIEIIVPSGGLIGGLSAVCVIAGVIMLSAVNTTLGLVSAVIALIALPFAAGFAIKIWPDTPIGRLLILKDEQPTDLGGDVDRPNRPTLPAGIEVGQAGEAITDLRPVGVCRIGGKRETCMATASIIEAGTPIEVVGSDGMQIKVKPKPEA